MLRCLAEGGCSILIVLHGLSEARILAHDGVLLENGRVHTAGTIQEVIRPTPIRAVYGVEITEGEGLGFHLPEGSA